MYELTGDEGSAAVCTDSQVQMMRLCGCRRILWAFKLNPFEKLNLRFDATPEDVRRQYKKLSLMVHPDKCKHPQASAAFEGKLLGSCRHGYMEKVQHCSMPDAALRCMCVGDHGWTC